jgi:hypothetical protein
MTHSFFGDFDEQDAFDLAPPDAEQVVRKLLRYRMEIEGSADWSDLTDEQMQMEITAMVRLLAWLRRQGAFG